MFGLEIHEESGRVVDLQTVQQRGSFVCRDLPKREWAEAATQKRKLYFLSRDSKWKQGTDQQWLRDSTDLFS
jgi:hypothetical protein